MPDADAQAKVIDSKAELHAATCLPTLRQPHPSSGRGQCRTHDQRSGASHKSPLLINKIVAERLSDKIQWSWFIRWQILLCQ